jgi:hypothetical protein
MGWAMREVRHGLGNARGATWAVQCARCDMGWAMREVRHGLGSARGARSGDDEKLSQWMRIRLTGFSSAKQQQRDDVDRRALVKRSASLGALS